MKLITGNRLDDGRVAYVAADGDLTSLLDQAARLRDAEAEPALERARLRSDVLVNPYLIEATDGRPSGRDRLKESIRAAGPTVGNSLGVSDVSL